jgi:Spy/CpxP family protein refolding chaperone
MSKIKLLYGIIALLLFLNLSLLVFIYTQAKSNDHVRPHRRNPKELIVKQLQFNETQVEQFEESVSWHRSHIKKLDDSIRSVRSELYRLLPSSAPDLERKKALLKQFAALQLKVEETHWQHFSEIKLICRPDQLKKYNKLTEQLKQLFSRGGRPPHPPKND